MLVQQQFKLGSKGIRSDIIVCTNYDKITSKWYIHVD